MTFEIWVRRHEVTAAAAKREELRRRWSFLLNKGLTPDEIAVVLEPVA